MVLYFSLNCGFNTQPPEGGWTLSYKTVAQAVVSTHSRLKAAGTVKRHVLGIGCVSTHSRLKAAGQYHRPDHADQRGFNTQPPEGGWYIAAAKQQANTTFQHTAA